MRCQVGDEVGYAIRFEDKCSAKTRIKFLTDGLLLREALVDPLLSRYSVIMVDEAHERSVSTDILLGVLIKIKKKRPELRLIVSSATLQADKMAAFFQTEDGQGCRIVSLEGRAFPVDILYLEQPVENYVEKAVAVGLDIHINEPAGDVLVFLSGREEIDTAIQLTSEGIAKLPARQRNLVCMPLHAGLTSDEQMYVFEAAPEDTRKIIFSTNIAEASVTVDGIAYVIDAGFAKLRAYNPQTGIDTLTAVPISKASATQRAGRAGRTKPGKCHRLYSEASFARLPDSTIPEIQRSNLASVVLQLKALGIDNIVRFNFLDPPPSRLLCRAFEFLYSLGAVDDYAKLTKPLGVRMAELALDPMMSKALLTAPRFGCLSEMLDIAAMTSLQGSVWFHHEGEKKAMHASRRKFAAEEGDHLTLLNAYRAFASKKRTDSKWSRENHLNHSSMVRAVSIRNQLRKLLERFHVLEESTPGQRSSEDTIEKGTQIRKCLTTGYFAHAARMQPDGTFKSVSGGVTMHAHPTSLMFVSCLVISALSTLTISESKG